MFNWQPIETMPENQEVFVCSDEGNVTTGRRTTWDDGKRSTYSPCFVGGYDWEWDFVGPEEKYGEKLIAWSEIPTNRPDWFVPKPKPILPAQPMIYTEEPKIVWRENTVRFRRL